MEFVANHDDGSRFDWFGLRDIKVLGGVGVLQCDVSCLAAQMNRPYPLIVIDVDVAALTNSTELDYGAIAAHEDRLHSPGCC